MQTILNEIVEYKIKELKQIKNTLTSQNRFRKTINKQDVALIGEIKLKSPSAGILGKAQNIVKRARSYEKAGVDVISVITNKNFFNGDIKLLKKVKKNTKLPILQKDFIIDPYQIYESKVNGADTILLIARIVTKQKLIFFVELAQSIGLEPIVEIYDKDDLEKAIMSTTSFIAVNARNLQTFSIDIDKACALIKKIPDKYIKLGFSGINTTSDVKKYIQAGAKAVLVGTGLMKTNNIKSYISSLKNV
ncbi:hypothetical protein A3C23_03170 [Candidatus Roizmanbacteria bacterium RIFCSPHIGHO2_02_FULL_37_13b]|nr:MAG: hypothetical protein A3C23_03170 [Candidatus Roizmanbacteria bacterium RIFCSPHIGHO2_02_FULL_37_13b]